MEDRSIAKSKHKAQFRKGLSYSVAAASLHEQECIKSKGLVEITKISFYR